MRSFLLLLGIILLLAAAPAPAADFPLQEGDVWVMAGDSITAQHLHSNYFEAFCFARYPGKKFAFRNSGVGGHTIPSTLARFDYDIAAWKPTIVSVELGMNDKGGTPTDKFISNMGTMVERIRGVKARPIILAPSPVNDGSVTGKLTGGNQKLHEYSVALKTLADQEKLPYGDQFHAVLDIWGKNKPRELMANSTNTLKALAQDESLAGVEHLRAFLAAQEKNPSKPVSMQGDPVHPGPPGQLMMAAALLKELGADGFVSQVTIDVPVQRATAKGCQVDNFKIDDQGISFERTDERLPFPIPDEARAVLPLHPTILELSQYTLQVKGLKGTNHQLKINGILAATLPARDLENGINLTALPPHPETKEAHPIVAQSRAILTAVSAKEGLVSQFRSLSQKAHDPKADPQLKEQMKEQLAALGKKVEEADAKIRAAAQPQKLKFELTPAP